MTMQANARQGLGVGPELCAVGSRMQRQQGESPAERTSTDRRYQPCGMRSELSARVRPRLAWSFRIRLCGLLCACSSPVPDAHTSGRVAVVSSSMAQPSILARLLAPAAGLRCSCRRCCPAVVSLSLQLGSPPSPRHCLMVGEALDITINSRSGVFRTLSAPAGGRAEHQSHCPLPSV